MANPHKYTVYELDEPLFVGQGGADVQSEAAVGSLRQQQQQHQQQQRPGKVRQLDADSRAETAEPVEQLRLGGSTSSSGGNGVAAMEVEGDQEAAAAAAASRPELPPTGGIKFAPTGMCV